MLHLEDTSSKAASLKNKKKVKYSSKTYTHFPVLAVE